MGRNWLARCMRMWEYLKVKETISCNTNSACHFFNVLTTEHSGSGVNPRLANQCGQVCGLMRRLSQGADCAHGTQPWQRSRTNNNNKVRWIGKGREVKAQSLIQWPPCSPNSGELWFFRIQSVILMSPWDWSGRGECLNVWNDIKYNKISKCVIVPLHWNGSIGTNWRAV